MIYHIQIPGTGITCNCAYGSEHYVGAGSVFLEICTVKNLMYYCCNAPVDQQYPDICQYCDCNKHREIMNARRE